MFVPIWILGCDASVKYLNNLNQGFSTCTGVCSRTDVCFEGNGDSAAEPSEMDPDSGHCSRTSVRGDDVVCFKKDHVELGRSFQMAVSVHDWTLAESLVPLADPQRLNDGLCIALDSIWFLR